MPTLPPRLCMHPGCGAVTSGRYCEQHRPASRGRPWAGRREGSSSQRGYGAAWRRLREVVLARDPLCRMCETEVSTVVDHILHKEFGGDDSLGNLQGLCDGCHTIKTRAESKLGARRGLTPCVVVCGPPGAGKTHWMQQRAKTGELRVDLDAIAHALTASPRHSPWDDVLPFAAAARDAVLDRLARGKRMPRAWVIATAPRRGDRDRLRSMLRARVIVLETPAELCLQRIKAQGRPGVGTSRWRDAVETWWRQYEPSPEDARVRPA